MKKNSIQSMISNQSMLSEKKFCSQEAHRESVREFLNKIIDATKMHDAVFSPLRYRAEMLGFDEDRIRDLGIVIRQHFFPAVNDVVDIVMDEQDNVIFHIGENKENFFKVHAIAARYLRDDALKVMRKERKELETQVFLTWVPLERELYKKIAQEKKKAA